MNGLRFASDTPTSMADFLENEAAAINRSIDDINADLDKNERDRDALRDRRADLARALVEMRVAAQVLRDTGLRSEARRDGPYVELPNPPAKPVP